MAAIIAAADGAKVGGLAAEGGGPTEEEVREKAYKSLLRDHGPMLELNCGGTVHCVYEETLRRVPNTLLANLTEDKEVRDKLMRDSAGRIFFDRHPQAFFEILVRPSVPRPENGCTESGADSRAAELLPHGDPDGATDDAPHGLGGGAALLPH